MRMLKPSSPISDQKLSHLDVVSLNKSDDPVIPLQNVSGSMRNYKPNAMRCKERCKANRARQSVTMSLSRRCPPPTNFDAYSEEKWSAIARLNSSVSGELTLPICRNIYHNIGHSTDHSTYRSTDHSIDRSTCHNIYRSTCRSSGRSICRRTGQRSTSSPRSLKGSPRSLPVTCPSGDSSGACGT